MAKAVFKAREFTVKVKGSKEFVSEEMVRAKLFAARKKKEAESMSVFAAVIKPEKSGTEEQITPTDQVENGVEHEVVAIYDNAGIPSFMHRFRKVTNKELFGGSDKVHPAFIVGGKEYDSIYISVYPNCEINGKPYSLPYQKPWTNITNDEAAEACFSKGEGWHMMTRAEWGLLANLSLRDGTLPHGNTNYGKYHADSEEKGEPIEGSGKTKTGSGPATWTHNHKVTGVHDLCGNVWEMVRGLRIRNGVLEAAKNNDAAMDIDLTLEGDCWEAIRDDEGKIIRISVDDDNICITTDPEIEQDYTGTRWSDVQINCNSEQLKELALFAGEPNAYCYMDCTDGEYLPICGGYWFNTSSAGVFNVYLNNPRSYSYASFGFRSAYYGKLDN